MQRESQRIDPYNTNMGTGVLGRMTDILSQDGHSIGSFSIDGNSVAPAGKPGVTNAPMILGRNGLPTIHLDDNTIDTILKLHNNTHYDSGIFAETWSSSLQTSFDTNELLGEKLANVTIQTEFPESILSSSLKTVAKVIATRDTRGSDVDTFFLQLEGKILFFTPDVQIKIS